MKQSRSGSGPSVGEILGRLGKMAPWNKAAGWDPVGLQVGDPDASAATLAVCHEVTEAVVSAIEADPVDLLVAYHPLLFRPTTRLVAGAHPAGRALRLARLGVSLAVAHTNYDVVPGGAADALAEAFRLEDVTGFGPVDGPEQRKFVVFVPEESVDAVFDAAAAAGAGEIGNYDHCSYRSSGTGTFFAGEGTDPASGSAGALNREPETRLEFVASASREADVVRALVAAHPYEEPAYDVYTVRGSAGLVGRIGRTPDAPTLGELGEAARDALDDPPLRIAGDPTRTIARLAVVPGAGEDLLDAAREAGADAVLTGDLRHHAARRALDQGLCLLDPGHIATERPGLDRLFVRLASLGLEARSLLGLDPDPWHADADGSNPDA